MNPTDGTSLEALQQNLGQVPTSPYPSFQPPAQPGYPQPSYPMQPPPAPMPGQLPPQPPASSFTPSPSHIDALAQQIAEDITRPTQQFPQPAIRPQEEKKGVLGSIPETFRAPVLIIVLYIFLSLPQVQALLRKYIKQLQAGEDGQVGMVGIGIYGALLGALFWLTRRFVE
jgi:hypothetical protein